MMKDVVRATPIPFFPHHGTNVDIGDGFVGTGFYRVAHGQFITKEPMDPGQSFDLEMRGTGIVKFTAFPTKDEAIDWFKSKQPLGKGCKRVKMKGHVHYKVSVPHPGQYILFVTERNLKTETHSMPTGLRTTLAFDIIYGDITVKITNHLGTHVMLDSFCHSTNIDIIETSPQKSLARLIHYNPSSLCCVKDAQLRPGSLFQMDISCQNTNKIDVGKYFRVCLDRSTRLATTHGLMKCVGSDNFPEVNGRRIMLKQWFSHSMIISVTSQAVEIFKVFSDGYRSTLKFVDKLSYCSRDTWTLWFEVYHVTLRIYKLEDIKDIDALRKWMAIAPTACEIPTPIRAPPPPCGHRPGPHSAPAGHYINLDFNQRRNLYINECLFPSRSDTSSYHPYVQLYDEDDGSGTYVSADTLQERNNNRNACSMPNHVQPKPKCCSHHCGNERIAHHHTNTVPHNHNYKETKTPYKVVVPSSEEKRRNQQNLQNDDDNLYEQPGSWYQPKSLSPKVSPREEHHEKRKAPPIPHKTAKASKELSKNEAQEYVEMRRNNNWNHQYNGGTFPNSPIPQNHQGTFSGPHHIQNQEVTGKTLPKPCRPRNQQQHVNGHSIPRRSCHETYRGTLQPVHQNHQGPLRNTYNYQNHTLSGVELHKSPPQANNTAAFLPCQSSRMKCELWVQDINSSLSIGCKMMNKELCSETILKKSNGIVNNNEPSKQKECFDKPPTPPMCGLVSREESSSVWISHMGDTSNFPDVNVNHDLDIEIRPTAGRLRAIRPPTHFTNSDVWESTNNDHNINTLPSNPGFIPQPALVNSDVNKNNIEVQKLCQGDVTESDTHAKELYSEDEGDNYVDIESSFYQDDEDSADETDLKVFVCSNSKMETSPKTHATEGKNIESEKSLSEQEQTARKLSFSSENDETEVNCGGSEIFQVNEDSTPRCSAAFSDDEITEMKHLAQTEFKEKEEFFETSKTTGEAQKDDKETGCAKHIDNLDVGYVVLSIPGLCQPQDNPALRTLPRSVSTLRPEKPNLPPKPKPTENNDNSTRRETVCSYSHSECCNKQNKLNECNCDCEVTMRKREVVMDRNIVESTIYNTVDPAWTDSATISTGPTVALPQGQPQNPAEKTFKRSGTITRNLNISPRPSLRKSDYLKMKFLNVDTVSQSQSHCEPSQALGESKSEDWKRRRSRPDSPPPNTMPFCPRTIAVTKFETYV